jgi:hypothetical protein
MAFIGGDSDKIKFILTEFGQKTLAEKGLEKHIRFCTFGDTDINYLVNIVPNVMSDISGNNNSIVPNSITNLRYILKIQ